MQHQNDQLPTFCRRSNPRTPGNIIDGVYNHCLIFLLSPEKVEDEDSDDGELELEIEIDTTTTTSTFSSLSDGDSMSFTSTTTTSTTKLVVNESSMSSADSRVCDSC